MKRDLLLLRCVPLSGTTARSVHADGRVLLCGHCSMGLCALHQPQFVRTKPWLFTKASTCNELQAAPLQSTLSDAGAGTRQVVVADMSCGRLLVYFGQNILDASIRADCGRSPLGKPTRAGPSPSTCFNCLCDVITPHCGIKLDPPSKLLQIYVMSSDIAARAACSYLRRYC